MKIDILNRFNGSVMFSHDCEKNTAKITVEVAIKIKADLRRADLGGADLGWADLGGADLGGADLRGAYLRGADLRGAYLGRAYLGGADLGGACLRGAYLRGANLRGAYLGRAYLGGAYLGDKENPISEIKQIGNIGSRGDFTIAFKCKTTIEINCGCFWGNIDAFEKQVRERHQSGKYLVEYLAAIEFIKKVFADEVTDEKR